MNEKQCRHLTGFKVVWKIRLIEPAVLFVVVAMLVSCGRRGISSGERMIDIGSHRLQVYLEGEGTPVVVFDSGISDRLDKLRPLQQRISRVTQTITYNRAGYGQSQPGPLPRHAGREAEELKALLERSAVPGPYLLVGHSLGALNVQVFASKYPDHVAGVVLLDPPPLSFLLRQDYRELGAMAEKMTAEWQAIADSAADSADAGEQARSSFFRMIASEHREMFAETASLVGGIATFGNMPLLVMAAGKPNPAFGEGADAYQRYWVEQSRLLAKKSASGRFIIAPESSHYLYVDAPELVEEAILAMVRGARARRAGSESSGSTASGR